MPTLSSSNIGASPLVKVVLNVSSIGYNKRESVEYNSTSGAHHIYRLKIPASINTLHGIGCTTFLFASKVPLLT